MASDPIMGTELQTRNQTQWGFGFDVFGMPRALTAWPCFVSQPFQVFV